MAGNAGKTPKARALGAELRELREDRQVSQRTLSQRVAISNASLSRYETGERVPSPEDVASIVTALGDGGMVREHLIEMARDAAQPNWLSSGASGIHRELTTLIEFERTATSIVEVSPMIVPGLLQTADYAREIMSGMSSAELETHVTMRAGRRDVLTRRRPVEFEAFIVEHVLRTPIGGSDVMADQLHHMTQMAELPNVTLYVVPSGLSRWHLALEGAFIYFEFPKAAPIVNLEHYRSSAYLHDSEDVSDYSRAITTLRETAMSPTESAELIASCVKEMEALT
ncbi:helix-turn-helix domain-containing protein [Haloactinomyces albus]|uniref:DNA-binding XRE family transcriptional regulator n=1 Tax=Haloactinomyces albus TaxID=1352928 RepID=A0AAE4CNU9_9ACTN|nr:helix-turn-helix transcriptional regulator [Haloactinomyces albus]MDR7301048.1 DNA-binding XRE family transcriptional regulator [Haloactinomyces albus]